jgi:Zn-dependent protease
LGDFIGGLDWSVLLNPAMRLIPLLICITLHELAHGFTAYRLGDPTAKRLGRLTLNPIKHIDPVGALMILLVGFGWAKPIPVDMHNLRNPKRDMAITAFAGPLTNIILAVLVLLILALVSGLLSGGDQLVNAQFYINSLIGIVPESLNEFIYQVIARTAWLSFILAFFNLLPIPPLDGSKILFSFLPDRWHQQLMRYERFGMVILLALLFIPRIPQFSGFPDILQHTVLRFTSFSMLEFSRLFGVIPYEIYSLIR